MHLPFPDLKQQAILTRLNRHILKGRFSKPTNLDKGLAERRISFARINAVVCGTLDTLARTGQLTITSSIKKNHRLGDKAG